jgi:hypothetical protein
MSLAEELDEKSDASGFEIVEEGGEKLQQSGSFIELTG